MNKKEKEVFEKEFPILYKSLENESDRASILVLGAMVEDVLTTHIKLRLLTSIRSKEDELLDGMEFNFKINLAYRLGLITKDEYLIFHDLRGIRNICAHQLGALNFREKVIKDSIRTLINRNPVVWKSVLSYDNKKIGDIESNLDNFGWRKAFELFFCLIVAHKKTAIDRVKKITALY